MANVSRPVNLFSTASYAVSGLQNQKAPVGAPVPKNDEIKESKTSKTKKTKTTKTKKNKTSTIKKKNRKETGSRKQLLPWM